MASPFRERGGPPENLVVTSSARIRILGPLVALVVPLALFLIAMLVLAAWPCSGRGCIEPSLGAWVLVLFALPTALMAGVPWFLNPVNVSIAVVTSLALWMVLGGIAGRRVADEPDAGWGTFAGELLMLTIGVLGGVRRGVRAHRPVDPALTT